jgi:serine/threonine protein kinase
MDNFNPYKADVYSLGTILYIMLAGELPYSSYARYTSLEKGKYPEIQFPTHCKASKEARELCLNMLDIDPEERISLVRVKNSNWLQKESFSTKLLQLMTKPVFCKMN